jgi:hypothetical protein
MTRKLGSLATLIAVALASLLAASGASARSLSLPVVRQVAQATVLKPNGVAYDKYFGEAWVSSVGPPPRLYAFSTTDFSPQGYINLPADSDPGSMAFGPDGYLYVIDHAHKRVFQVCTECGDFNVITFTSNVDFLTDYIDGYRSGPMLLDFGNGFSAGSIWSGAGFMSRFLLPDTITPNGGEILPDTAKPAKGRIPDEILIADAENNHLVGISDTPTPAVLGTISVLPGNPGLQPPRDVTVNPLNLNPNVAGPAIHPIYVAFPDLGIYESAGPTGPWTQIPATGIGRPTQVASDCDTVGATSFSQNLVTFFDVTQPKGSHCEDFVELLLKPGSGAPLTLAGGLEAYVTGGGKIEAVLGGSARSASAAESKSRKKLRFTAGKVTKFKIKLPSAVAAVLRNKHKAIITVKIKVTGRTGQKATVIRRVRIRS